MRYLSIFLALLLTPLTLPAQTSALYSPPRPSRACPVYMAAHRIAGNAMVQAVTPVPSEEEKQMRARVLELKQQIDALKAQEADLQGKLGQNPDAGTSAGLQRQLNELDVQIKENELEANQLTVDLALEQAKSQSNGVYGPTAGLDLNIAGASRTIIAVDILVHGFSNRGQLLPASQIPNAVVPSPQVEHAGPSDLDRNRSGASPIGISPTESFHLIRDGSGGSIHASIMAKGMTGISWLEVTRVEFADGSTWQPAEGQTCRFAPSLYVPVGATLSAH